MNRTTEFKNDLRTVTSAYMDFYSNGGAAQSQEQFDQAVGVKLEAFIAKWGPEHMIAAFLERSGQYLTNDATREAALAEAASTGWKACRKQVFTLSEDFIDKHPANPTDYQRGVYQTAKAFAKAMGGFGPEECDFLRKDLTTVPAFPQIATAPIERALLSLVEGVRHFRNEPSLGKLLALRGTPGFCAMVDAWDDAQNFLEEAAPQVAAPAKPMTMRACGDIPWVDLQSAIGEAIHGDPERPWLPDESCFIGHQMVPINMNSLNRIVSLFAHRARAAKGTAL